MKKHNLSLTGFALMIISSLAVAQPAAPFGPDADPSSKPKSAAPFGPDAPAQEKFFCDYAEWTIPSLLQKEIEFKCNVTKPFSIAVDDRRFYTYCCTLK